MENTGSIGSNVRKCRQRKGFTQEMLAERAGISTNYLGAIERGEKIPALETLVDIINALEVSADEILYGVIKMGYVVQSSMITEKVNKLSDKDRKRIFDVIDVEIRHSIQEKP